MTLEASNASASARSNRCIFQIPLVNGWRHFQNACRTSTSPSKLAQTTCCDRCVGVTPRQNSHISLKTYDAYLVMMSELLPIFMVGFPGETDAHFEASCQFVKDIGFSQLHVFRYSPRKGTPAATYPDQVSPHVSAARSQAMIALGERLNIAFDNGCLGNRKRCSLKRAEKGKTSTSQALLTTISVSLWMPQRAQSIRSRALRWVR